jgi:uncharacterized membrane protein
MTQWSLEPVFGWLGVLPLAVIMLASLWLTLTNRGVSRAGRTVLVVLRLLAIAILLLGWLRPGMISTVERETESAIAVLIDSSESMTMPSGNSEKSRWQVARETWEAIEAGSRRGFGKTRFVPFLFDRTLRAAATTAPADAPAGGAATVDSVAIFKNPPTGRATDLGTALAELQRTQVQPPLRGAIMLTDGVQTTIPAPVDPTLVARQMAQLDQPLLLVGIGPRGETSQLRDLALEGVPEHLTAFEKNRLTIPAVIQARGMQNAPIRVNMTLKASGKPDIRLKSTEVTAAAAEQTLPLNLEVEAPESGEYLLEIRAQSEVREQVTSNNVAISFLTVRSGGSRILYIEGQPRHEQTFLKRAVNASLDFQVEYVWIQQVMRRNWPIDLTREHNFAQYDAFILGDVDAAALSPNTFAGIRQRVESGAGLMLLGGYHSYDAGGYVTTPLAPLFPVALTAGRRQAFEAPIDPGFHLPGPIPFIPIVPHPITQLAPEPENTEIWKGLKPLMSVNRLGRPRLAPGVQVIAAGPENQPLLVTGEAGRGRVLAFAGDSTYQWWMQGQQLRHKQFWRQAILWLIGRDSLQEGFRLILDRRRMLLDEEETVGIEWVGGTENKPMPAMLQLELTHEGRWLRTLESQAAGENRRQVRLRDLNQPGLYRLQLKSTAEDGTAYETDVAFLVRDESRELANPLADWQQMQNLASASEIAGGRLIQPEEIEEALQWLRARQADSRVTTIEKRRLGDGLADAWIYFLLFSAVMTAEWALRKRWQLP